MIIQEVTEVANPVNIMANKTYVVTLKETPPYTMLKEEVGNWNQFRDAVRHFYD